MSRRALVTFLLLAACEAPAELDQIELHGSEPGGLMQTVLLDNGCVGVLLSPTIALTAGHCVDYMVAAQWAVGVSIPSNIGSGRVAETAAGEIIVAYPIDHELTGLEWDAALLSLLEPVDLDMTARPYATITTAAPDPGGYWLNGRILDGVDTEAVRHVGTALAPLDPSDPRYPFQLLASASPIEQGDSGGPLFRERAGEANDGMGGSAVPEIFGVVSRGGAYTRLDPIAVWIAAESAALDARRDQLPASCSTIGATLCEHEGDDHILTCNGKYWTKAPCTGGTTCRAEGVASPWCLGS